MDPQVGKGLFGVHLLILHFKLQFSKSIKCSTFHILLNLTYPLRKNISFPKDPKFTQNRKTLVNVLSRGIWRCLKRERDIGGKAMLSDVKTAFRCTPALLLKSLHRVLGFIVWGEVTSGRRPRAS